MTTTDPTRSGGYPAADGTVADVPPAPRGPAPGAAPATDPTTEPPAGDRREHVVANAIAWELYGIDGRPTGPAGDTLAIRVTDAERDTAYRAARRVLTHLAELHATEQPAACRNCAGIETRAHHYQLLSHQIGDDGSADLSRAAQRSAEDVPALLAEVRRQAGERDRLERETQVRTAEVDQLAEQLRQAPGWCRACPSGCTSCMGPDCECYDHGDLHPEMLQAHLADMTANRDKVVARLHEARAELEQLRDPGVYQLPAEPPADVTELWDVEGVRWERQHPGIDRWVADEAAVWHSVRTFAELLARGPLSTTPPAGTEAQ